MKKFALCILILGFIPVFGAEAQQSAKYDAVTSSQALAVQAGINADVKNIGSELEKDEASEEVYSSSILNRIIEDHELISVVRDRDRCQFTPDIEDRARLVQLPVFMFAWGDLLVNGVCVKKDEELGLSYIEKAADNAYGPALERLSFYYEKGFLVSRNKALSERYMHTSAVLGSKSGRLGWADMLVRGFGTPSMYEEAFGWLYHADYHDEYSKLKQRYLEKELERRLPPEVIARSQQLNYN